MHHNYQNFGDPQKKKKESTLDNIMEQEIE